MIGHPIDVRYMRIYFKAPDFHRNYVISGMRIALKVVRRVQVALSHQIYTYWPNEWVAYFLIPEAIVNARTSKFGTNVVVSVAF